MTDPTTGPTPGTRGARLRRTGRWLLPALLLSLVTACGSGSDGSDDGSDRASDNGSDGSTSASGSPSGSGSASEAVDTTLTVFAASSLTQTFTDLGGEFEADHPGVTVQFSFGGSSDLVAQIDQGAPADVVATADTTTMDSISGDVEDPVDFATNILEIATPPDNPGRVTSLQDLGRAGLDVVVCAPEVPCGAAAQQVTEESGVLLRPVSEEQSVTDVLGKVTSGEADAGLVYRTDVLAAGGDVHGVRFPEARAVVNHYPIATVSDGDHQDLASEFVDLVTGQAGQSVLGAAGFGAP